MKNFKKIQRGDYHPFSHNLGRFFGEKRSFDHLSLINLENFIFDENKDIIEQLIYVYEKRIESFKINFIFNFISIEA